MNIYVNFKKPKTLRSFLKKLFSEYRYSGARTLVETYHDKKCTNVQCGARKRRSFDNVLEIVQTYFPEITLKELMSVLLTLKIKDKNGSLLNLYMNNCGDIRKIILIYYNQPNSLSLKGISKIEQYSSKYSWKELLGMVGIKSQDELDEFVKNKK